MSKEKKQIIALAAVLIIITSVILYTFREAILPKPTARGVDQAQFLNRAEIPSAKGVEGLFMRPDYKMLKMFGDVPVRSTGPVGTENPFEIPVEVADE